MRGHLAAVIEPKLWVVTEASLGEANFMQSPPCSPVVMDGFPIVRLFDVLAFGRYAAKGLCQDALQKSEVG